MICQRLNPEIREVVIIVQGDGVKSVEGSSNGVFIKRRVRLWIDSIRMQVKTRASVQVPLQGLPTGERQWICRALLGA